MSEHTDDPADDGLDEAERRLFRDAVADVRRLHNDRAESHRPRPSPRPRQREADERAVMEALLDPPPDPAEVETGEELAYARPGVQKAVMRRLRRGHYPPRAHLDLHGKTRREAYQALVAFLEEARARGQHCVRVIHGKGRGSGTRQPVLKVAVDHWLRRRDEVLAFASAPATDGGTGAVYVLLRQRSG